MSRTNNRGLSSLFGDVTDIYKNPSGLASVDATLKCDEVENFLRGNRQKIAGFYTTLSGGKISKEDANQVVDSQIRMIGELRETGLVIKDPSMRFRETGIDSILPSEQVRSWEEVDRLNVKCAPTFSTPKPQY